MPENIPKVEAARELVQRATRPIAPLLGILLVQPQEFAERIRENIRLRRNPRRLLKCIEDLEAALRHRGIEMRAYFAALRRELARYAGGQTNGHTNGHTNGQTNGDPSAHVA
ncbi:MAG: hypothetical protein ABR537_01880 [Gemmatimonadales bacterium]